MTNGMRKETKQPRAAKKAARIQNLKKKGLAGDNGKIARKAPSG